jgi:NADPH:quinone reductase-like Zn-dependent oxidoreductase
MLGAKVQARRSGKRAIPISFTPVAEDVEFGLDLYAKHALRPTIDRRYNLDGIVDAHLYVDTGRKRGTVVLEVEKGS